ERPVARATDDESQRTTDFGLWTYMRVTANTFPDSLIDQLSSLSQRQGKLQTQAASGQRVQLPEDDPAAMHRVLELQAEGKSLAQYQRNIAHHQEIAASTFNALKALKQVSNRVGEISVSADGLKPQTDLNLYAKEVTELIKQAVQIANSQDRTDYLFSGTLTDRPPFVMTTDANGNATSVTYQGNTTLAQTEITNGVAVSAQAVGANTSGGGPRGLITDDRVGADFFNHLISLQNNLLSGNVSAIQNTDRPDLTRDEDNFLFHLGT